MKMEKRTVRIMMSLLICLVIAGLAPQVCAPAYAAETSATVTVKPVANKLTYNAEPQELVTAGEASNGTMQYAIGGRNDAPSFGWSPAIPEKEPADLYYVWFKAVGEGGFGDSDPECVPVRIAKRHVRIIANDQDYTYVAKYWWQGPGDAVYDDPDEIAQKVTVEGLQGDDCVENVTVDGQGDMPGEYPLIPTNAPIFGTIDGHFGNVTDNYEREYVDGTLTVYVVLKIRITGSSAVRAYNGKEQTYKGTVTATIEHDPLGLFDVSKFQYTGNTVVKGTKAGNYVLKLNPGSCKYERKYCLLNCIIGNPIKLTIKKDAQPSKPSGVLLAKLTAKGKKSLVVKWTKVKGAEGYDIFFGKCSGKNEKKVPKKVKTVKGNKKFKWTKKKLKKGKAYKTLVKAWVEKDGKKKYVKKSPIVHAYAGGGTGKSTNPKSVTVKKKKVTLKKGKSFKIKAKANKLQEGKKLIGKGHAAKLRYVSSDKKIATVSAKGKIKAKKKGSCKVYVLTVNGAYKTIKVKVK